MTDPVPTDLPDLKSPEGRAAYRRTLRGIAAVPRRIGFIIVILGAGALIAGYYWEARPAWLLTAGRAVLIGGWAILIYAFFRRNRFHWRNLKRLRERE